MIGYRPIATTTPIFVMGLFSFGRKKNKATASDSPDDSVDKSAALDKKLHKTRATFTSRIVNFLRGSGPVDENLLEELEDQLLTADVGVEATRHIVDTLAANVKRMRGASNDDVIISLKNILIELLQPCESALEINTDNKPFVILVVGVNGAGKTTTIGKLASKLQAGGLSVMLAAGDTFRAAAIEQLQTWGERNGVPVIAQQQGSDSASVIFDAVQSAQSRGIDVVIADTAGRLHTQAGLMDELSKVKRVIGKLDATAPHETLLVLDGGTGQNALRQAQEFNQAMDVSGLVITKLDGTAKGGVLFSLSKQMSIPVRFIGVGEKVDDLRVFEPQAYVEALLGNSESDDPA